MKSTADQLEKLQDDVYDIPRAYVSKTDYNHDRDRLLDGIEKLGDKVDASVLNIEADYNRRMDKLEAIMVKGAQP